MTIIHSNKSLRTREKNDFYPTPYDLCHAALRALEIENPGFRPDSFLDPGAGTGVWGNAVRSVFSPRLRDGIDIRELPQHPDYTGWIQGDYLEAKLGRFDLIAGNPPYKHAEEFVRKSFQHIASTGYILFLFRLSFLESQKRARGLWKEHPPAWVWVSAKRISFTGNGKSDDTAYALYLWQPMYHGETRLGWLDWEYEKQ